ncbi:MAG TPA: hypothetical protein VE954_06090 [Oligoflexus sp.]|uniref:hypothetical protein n=1 Tax=Oligoflexus sp. TaxID=1971216 RepID=UPI002D46140D|nr:hypothetical protein [Oligoflexus sp.]HYX32664.1 hypothetical protein [Oligoflexus sp.]
MKILVLCLLTWAASARAGESEQRIMAIQQAKIEALQKQVTQMRNKVKSEGLTLQIEQCGGTHYNCSVRSCIDMCISKGGRVAHRHELANIALKGQNHCAFTISYDVNNNRFDHGYPMYNFQGSGCANSNQTPSLPSMPLSPDIHNTVIAANCACMLPMVLD